MRPSSRKKCIPVFFECVAPLFSPDLSELSLRKGALLYFVSLAFRCLCICPRNLELGALHILPEAISAGGWAGDKKERERERRRRRLIHHSKGGRRRKMGGGRGNRIKNCTPSPPKNQQHTHQSPPTLRRKEWYQSWKKFPDFPQRGEGKKVFLHSLFRDTLVGPRCKNVKFPFPFSFFAPRLCESIMHFPRSRSEKCNNA